MQKVGERRHPKSRNRSSGASHENVGLHMFPADETFIASISKDQYKFDQAHGQIRQHVRLINVLTVQQHIVGVNKMDCDITRHVKNCLDENKKDGTTMLLEVEWKIAFAGKSVPIVPISICQEKNTTSLRRMLVTKIWAKSGCASWH